MGAQRLDKGDCLATSSPEEPPHPAQISGSSILFPVGKNVGNRRKHTLNTLLVQCSAKHKQAQFSTKPAHCTQAALIPTSYCQWIAGIEGLAAIEITCNQVWICKDRFC